MMSADDELEEVDMAAAGMSRFRPASLRRARARRRLTLRDVAALSGVSAATISSWETGTRCPSPRSLAKVAEVLEVDIGDLAPVAEHRSVLEDLRVQLGLSVTEAAKRARLGPGPFREIETGHRTPNAKQHAAFLGLYGLSDSDFEELFDRTRALLVRQLTGR